MIIALETSGAVGSVALWSGEAVLGSRSFDTQQEAVRRLPPAVRELLAVAGEAATAHRRDAGATGSAGATGTAVRGLAVSRGPGSFNGLRVGVALAKALAHAWRVPVAGIATPLVWAAETAARFPGRPVAVLQPSRREYVYLTIVESGKWNVERGEGEGEVECGTWNVERGEGMVVSGTKGPPGVLRGPEIVAVESLGEVLAEAPDAPVLTGDWADLEEWSAQQGGFLLDTAKGASPSAETVARLAGWALGQAAADSYYILRPEYVSPSQAERNWGVNLGL